MAQVYSKAQADSLLAGKADASALAGKADASAVSKNATDISAARALAVGYATQAVSGSSTITVSQGTYALDVTGAATLTLSAANGVAVSLDVVLASGASLTVVDGPTITTSGVYTLLRSRGVWKSGATSSTSTGTGTTPGTGTGTTPAADTTAPTAPMAAVKSATTSSLTVTVSGGTDAVGVTQYRAMAGTQAAWATRTGAGDITLSGLTAGTSYTVSAQAGDAAGNWSTSATVNGSTSAAPVNTTPTTYASYTNALAPVTAYDFDGSLASTGSVTTPATLPGGGVLGDGGVINEFKQALKIAPGSGGYKDGAALAPASASPTQAGTVMMLTNITGDCFNANGTVNWGNLLLNYEGDTPGSNTSSLGISVVGGKRALRAFARGVTTQTPDNTFTFGAPHLVGLRFDGSTMSLWLDGVKVGSVAHTNTVPWTGKPAIGFVSYLSGSVNGFRAWTSALTDEQMLGAAKAAGVAS